MEELKKRLQEIKVDAVYGHQKHFIASERKNNLHRLIGIPLLVINISIGTSLFAIFNEGESEWKYIPIIFSYIAAILTGLQTFLKFDKQAVGHHNIGLKYLEVDKKIRNYESQIDSKLISDPKEIMLSLIHISEPTRPY